MIEKLSINLLSLAYQIVSNEFQREIKAKMTIPAQGDNQLKSSSQKCYLKSGLDP